MTTRKIVQQLAKLDACSDAMEWVKKTPGTGSQLWTKCKEPAWLFWLAGKTIDKNVIVLAGCDCARTSLKWVTKGDDRPRLAIEAAEAFVAGKITREELRAAAHAATYANAAATYAHAAATYAHAAATYAHAAATYAAYAAAANAANAAHAATNAAHAAERKHKLLCCKVIRKRITWAMIEKGL